MGGYIDGNHSTLGWGIQSWYQWSPPVWRHQNHIRSGHFINGLFERFWWGRWAWDYITPKPRQGLFSWYISGTPLKFNIAPSKRVVGRLLSYWEGNFSGAMLNFGRVSFLPIGWWNFSYRSHPENVWSWKIHWLIRRPPIRKAELVHRTGKLHPYVGGSSQD